MCFNCITNYEFVFKSLTRDTIHKLKYSNLSSKVTLKYHTTIDMTRITVPVSSSNYDKIRLAPGLYSIVRSSSCGFIELYIRYKNHDSHIYSSNGSQSSGDDYPYGKGGNPDVPLIKDLIDNIKYSYILMEEPMPTNIHCTNIDSESLHKHLTFFTELTKKPIKQGGHQRLAINLASASSPRRDLKPSRFLTCIVSLKSAEQLEPLGIEIVSVSWTNTLRSSL